MESSVVEISLVMDRADHGSSIPLEKITLEVVAASRDKFAMPISSGNQLGRGFTPKRFLQVAERLSPDQLYGGNMSVILLADIGWIISVHAR